MKPRVVLTTTSLLLLPAMPLVAQDTTGETEAAAAEAVERAETVDTADATDAAGAADTVEVAPHPHEGFEFPSNEIETAADAGLTWLRLVDAGEFEEGWTTGSAMLQSSVTPQQLKSTINDGREPFRPLGARTLVGFSQLTNPPNAAPGDYVMLQYRTEVSGDRTIIETVVPRQDGDAWRVAAYFIQRE